MAIINLIYFAISCENGRQNVLVQFQVADGNHGGAHELITGQILVVNLDTQKKIMCYKIT